MAVAIPPAALEWAERLARFPEVDAVALGGSAMTGTADDASDLDLEVYVSGYPSLADRRALIEPVAVRDEVGNDFFGPGDEWIDRDGRAFDVAYFETAWMEAQLDRVLRAHEASTGYSTCFWHTVRESRVLFDRSGRLAAMKERSSVDYPEGLRRAVVAKNHPILRENISSYRGQIARALGRGDAVSVNHRVAALLASCFDILFAVNRVPHPGEKRLLQHVDRRCPVRPAGFDELVSAVLRAGTDGDDLLPDVDALIDGIDRVLDAEGLLPAS